MATIVVTHGRPLVGPIGTAPSTRVMVPEPGHLRSDANQDNWDSGNAAPLSHQIEQVSFKVSYAARHFLFHDFHWNDLDPDINVVVDEERHVFDEKIMSDKRILSKLNLDRDPIFHEIRLIVSPDRVWAALKNFLFLLVRFQPDDFLHHLDVFA